MHSYTELGDRLRPERRHGRRLIALLKRNFQAEIARMRRTPLFLGGKKILTLDHLQAAILDLDPEIVRPFADSDILSGWLDRQGYPELAEELRPIHGSGAGLSRTLTQAIEKWIRLYKERDRGL
jgi:hypothetical protein